MANPNGRRRNNKNFGETPSSSRQVTCPRCKGIGKVDPDNISIGDRYRICREKLHLTQAEMAPKLNISRAQLANLEGDRSRPGLESLVKAADAFWVSVDYLLGRS